MMKVNPIILILAFLGVVLGGNSTNSTNGTSERISPGISMSMDLKLIEQFKDTHMSTLLRQLNGQPIGNISLGLDGHIRQNKAFIKVRNSDIVMKVDPEKNAYIMQMKDLYLFIRSQDFKYTLWFVPIKATLDVEVGDVDLDFQIELKNTTVQYINETLGINETRIVPQILIQKAELQIDPKKMKFNIGGSFVAQIVDIILPMFSRLITTIMNTQVSTIVTQTLPAQFNDFSTASKGFFEFGSMFNNSGWNGTTFDFQLDNLDLSSDSKLNIALNGTIFNNRTTGYRHLANVSKPHKMPFYDPKINSTWQLFISTFLLEHATQTLLDEAPIEYYLPWNFMPDKPEFAITTDAAETFFPFLTQKFGYNVPVDLNVKVMKIWNWFSNSTNSSIAFNINLGADAYLHLSTGDKKYIGSFEYLNGTIIAGINITDMNVTGKIYYVEFQQAFIETTYGVARFEASPFLMNIILFGGLAAANGVVLEQGVLIPHNITAFMNIKDVFLGYYDDYIALGLTPHFNKPIRPIKPINNTTNTTDPKVPPKKELSQQSFFERLGNKLYDLHKSIYGIDESEEAPVIQNDQVFFKHFDAKRLATSCEFGRCGYITDVIDQLETEHQK